MSPRDATIQSMGEIQTALIAIALVLSAVFLPMAFFGGSVGVIYRQFSITIVSAMVLSVVVALVLSPALAATLLQAPERRASKRHAAGPRGSGCDAAATGSTAASTAWPSATRRRRRSVRRSQAAVPARSMACSSCCWWCSFYACRPASCRPRTRAARSSSTPCRRARPWRARWRRCSADRALLPDRGEARTSPPSSRSSAQRPGGRRPERRPRLRRARALGRAHGQGEQRAGASPAARPASSGAAARRRILRD